MDLQQRHFCRCFAANDLGTFYNGISAVVSLQTAWGSFNNGISAVVSLQTA
ncbi:hypothetical protein [Paenibacillus graminis]|uniref:hypothetical protein n=1 Tax=Paenibacillus graminis TaxID=189425 RepID=UPI002DB8BB4F|nr:hypothetical protein [Paenibacillus graminis]MEC0166831.1 hypothetical protein [Paenibacillus graminis]